MAGKTNKKSKKKNAKPAMNSKERKELVIQKRSELANLQMEIDAKAAADKPIEKPQAADTKASAAVENAVEAAEKASAKTGETAKKAPAKATASKTASDKPKKEVAKKIMIENFFEIDGTQVCAEKVCEKIQKAWVAEGHKASELKSLKTYYNFAERKAYYVINDEPAGFVEF